MTVGPLELLVLGFEGHNFKGEIAKAIKDAVDTGAIRVVDIMVVKKDADGSVTAIEVESASDDFRLDISGISADLRDLLTEDEALTVAAALPPDTAALVALIEHTWSVAIAEAVRRANGRLLASHRISARLIDAVREEVEKIMASEPAEHAMAQGGTD